MLSQSAATRSSKCHYVKYPDMLALVLCTSERWSWPCPVSTQQQLLQRLGIIFVLRYMLDVVYEEHVHSNELILV